MNALIQHVSIPRPPGSEKTTRHFYGELLGFCEVTPPHSLRGVLWYRLGEAELHLFEQEVCPPGLSHHLCFAFESASTLAHIRERLEEAGYATHDTTPIPGRPRFFVRDPFDNRLEFTVLEGDYLTLQHG